METFVEIIETTLDIDYFNLEQHNKENVAIGKRIAKLKGHAKVCKITTDTDLFKLLQDVQAMKYKGMVLIFPDQLSRKYQGNLHIGIKRLIQLYRHFEISLIFLVSHIENIHPFIAKYHTKYGLYMPDSLLEVKHG